MTARRIAALALAAALWTAGCRTAPVVDAMTGNGNQRDGYTLVLRGNRELSDADLRRAMALSLQDFEESQHEPAAIDDAAFDLALAYREAGFPFVEVDWDLSGEPPAQEVRFHIREGPRTRIGDVRFEGNEVFDDEELTAFVEGPRTGLLGTGDVLYVEARARAATARIEAAYLGVGHLDVRVAPPRPSFSPDRTRVDLDVAIDEGPQYRLERVDLQGEMADLEPRFRATADEYVGQPYRPRLAYELRGKLAEALADEGYPRAEVGLELERRVEDERGLVDLALRIDPGQRVVLSEVRLVGLDKTREGFVRSRMELEAGDEYDESDLRESVRAIYATGLFREVRADLGQGDESDVLTVRVVEEPSIETFIEPGYGSYELFRVRAGVREQNLLGYGWGLGAEGKLAVRAESAEVQLTDPWFLHTPLQADYKIDYERREEPSFTSQKIGAGVFFTRKWTSQLSTRFGYQFRRSEARDVDASVVGTPALANDVDLSSLLVSQVWDTRLGVFAPLGGQRLEGSLEWGDGAIGSELDFLRPRVTLGFYRALREDTVLAVGLRTGWIFPRGDDVIPIQERFFNGGENSVRSYGEDELGPRDANDNPLGGEAFQTLNVELRQRLLGKLDGGLFFDAGTVSTDAEDLFRYDDVGTGIGVGLRYMLPIGPLRLDAAWNPDPEPDEASGAVHFAVGMAF